MYLNTTYSTYVPTGHAYDTAENDFRWWYALDTMILCAINNNIIYMYCRSHTH
jgi:hypothetical protein